MDTDAEVTSTALPELSFRCDKNETGGTKLNFLMYNLKGSHSSVLLLPYYFSLASQGFPALGQCKVFKVVQTGRLMK